MIISRDFYLKQLICSKHNGMIKVITGLRRSGKSFLLFELFYKHLLDTARGRRIYISKNPFYLSKASLHSFSNPPLSNSCNTASKALNTNSSKLWTPFVVFIPNISESVVCSIFSNYEIFPFALVVRNE